MTQSYSGVMTHATQGPDARHDTLAAVTGKSGRGTARQTIRVDEALWEQFGERAASVDNDRSALLRDFMRWFVREPGAKMPKRPD
jgi:hypothetical protein